MYVTPNPLERPPVNSSIDPMAGLSIGALCPSTEAALTMGPSVMVIFILLSGQVRALRST
jgi:hypothetical protein